MRAPGCGKQPLRVVDAASAAAAAAAPADTVPVFSVSSVTGAGLPLLKKYLHALSPSPGAIERKRLEQVGSDGGWVGLGTKKREGLGGAGSLGRMKSYRGGKRLALLT